MVREMVESLESVFNDTFWGIQTIFGLALVMESRKAQIKLGRGARTGDGGGGDGGGRGGNEANTYADPLEEPLSSSP